MAEVIITYVKVRHIYNIRDELVGYQYDWIWDENIVKDKE